MQERDRTDAHLPPLTLPDLSPEARRRRARDRREEWQAAFDRHVGAAGLVWRSRPFRVMARVWTGAYHDGFIHAGNLAYMAILALFPFFVTVGAVFSAIGESQQRTASVHALLAALPPVVARVLEPVGSEVIQARHGWLLWAGGAVGLWTVGSLIETIRDILRRAYGTPHTFAFWRYRLISTGVIAGAVAALLFALLAQVALEAVQQVLAARFPELGGLAPGGLDWALATSRLLVPLVIFVALYLLFFTLTPRQYRARQYPKWPGAALVTVWWVAVSAVLPRLLGRVFKYDLTYGSLAGVMIALFFFWLVGLGMVVGAELNAALAESPEERDLIGQADNRGRVGPDTVELKPGQD